ncbi:pyridoxine [Blumeria hordei DH14]|uniref:glutaminase n=1 Tax=Blumeria graminis f. sp. hordei (strain DH14) TaxID=546991 RepID=N1JHE6_BLUG1|nr:pyridoxine [Blumeria hordei DH14]
MDSEAAPRTLTVGVLALQGAFSEHFTLLRQAACNLTTPCSWTFREVRTEPDLAVCDALILPGGESTTMALVAQRSGLLEPLRHFVKIAHKPTWGTCAGLILLADAVVRSREGGQDLIGGLHVQAARNHFGRQTESFEADLHLPFLAANSPPDASTEAAPATTAPFRAIFIRAPIVEKVLPIPTDAHLHASEATPEIPVRILAVLPRREAGTSPEPTMPPSSSENGDIIAVQQANIFATSFHPELTGDARIHEWWLEQVVQAIYHK